MKRATECASMALITAGCIIALTGCGGSSEAPVTSPPDPVSPPPPAAPPLVTGSAVVSWSVPSLNTDGTSIADISGYVIHYGPAPTDLRESVFVSGAGTTSGFISGLASGTYYFTVATMNSMGVTSAASNAVSKTVP